MKEIAKDDPIPGGRLTANFGLSPGRVKLKVLSKGWISRISRSFGFEHQGKESLLNSLSELADRFDRNEKKEERKIDWIFRVGNGIKEYKFLGMFPYDGENADFEVFRVETKKGPFIFMSDKMNPIFLPRKTLDRMAELIREQDTGGNAF